VLLRLEKDLDEVSSATSAKIAKRNGAYG